MKSAIPINEIQNSNILIWDLVISTPNPFLKVQILIPVFADSPFNKYEVRLLQLQGQKENFIYLLDLSQFLS